MTTINLGQAKRALDEFRGNYHTGIDLMHHPPNDVPISDESLTEFAYSLEQSSSELSHMKSVAEKVLTKCVESLSNVDNISRIVLSECHLCGCGRNDTGLDMVVLMKETENLNQTTDELKSHISRLTSASAGRQVQPEEQSGVVERHEAPSLHTKALHFEHDSVHVNIAVGHRYSAEEEPHRVAIWNKIDQLDKSGQLKKVHLDQFAIDLYESTTLFMNNQVAPGALGSEQGVEKFVQGALRLSRAWRQCCLSSRDIQFSPLDTWLVMLHSVQLEITKHVSHQPPQAKTESAISGIRKTLKELIKGKGVQGKIKAGGREVSMKNVMKQFLHELANLEQMNIQFSDFYDSSKIPDWIKTQRPLVLDPVCPYRNTVYNLHKHVNQDIKRHAQECIKILDDPNASLTKLFHLPTYKKRGA